MKELSLMKEPEKMNLNNSGKIILSRLVNIRNIKTQKEFEELFPLIPANLEKIKRRMAEKEYDNSQPVHLWDKDGKLVLIDGHHRLIAARELGITEIPGYFHYFESIEEAVEYAIALQVERRNLSDAELLIMIKVVDQLKIRGKGASGEKGKSAKRTAEILGTNASKIEKARIVEKYGDEEIKKKVASGELSLNQAYLEARTAKEQGGANEEGKPGAAPDCSEEGNESETGDGVGNHCAHEVSPSVKFLNAAATLLYEKKEMSAIKILINHFLRKRERPLFYKALPQEIQEHMENGE
jgi:ParB family chromosome partitioning protein